MIPGKRTGDSRNRQRDIPLLLLWTTILFLFICRGLPIAEALLGVVGEATNVRYSLPTVILLFVLGAFGTISTFRSFLTRERTSWPMYANYILGLSLLTFVSYVRTIVIGKSDYSASIFLEFIVSFVLVHLVYLSFDTELRLRWLFKAIAFAGIITSSFYLFSFAPSGEDLWRVGNLGAEGATYNTLAYNLAAALWVGPWVLVATQGIRSVGVRGLLYFILATPLMIGGILLTGTKGAVLIVALLCFLSEYIRMRQSKKLWQIVANWRTLLTVVAAACVVAYMDESAPVQRAVVFEAETWTSRSEILSSAFEQLIVNPITVIMGQGVGMFSFIGPDNVEYTYPHNLFLDVALNIGVPGAVIMFLLLLRCFSICARLGRMNEQEVAGLRVLALTNLGFGIVALIAGLISFRFASNIMLFMFVSITARLQYLAQQYSIRATAITVLDTPLEYGANIPSRASRAML